MPIGRTNFDEISEADLIELIEAGVPEGMAIEYKREPYGNSDANKREALKDITSFANSAGGHLIIGMEEADGVPVRLTGLRNADLDVLINRLESLARDGVEPRIVGIRMRRVDIAGGGSAVVIRIPRSWNPPHRVTSQGANRFFVRNSGGAHEASVEELRMLFNLAQDAQNRIKQFRSDRIGAVMKGEGPVNLPAVGQLFVHIVPLAAFGHSTQIDIHEARRLYNHFRPMASAGMSPRYNLDGFINLRGGEQIYGYTQIFRNGSLEATKANICTTYHGERLLPAGTITGNIVEVISDYFEGLRALGVPPPIVLMVSFQGIAGAKLGIKGYDHRLDEIAPFPANNPLFLPEIIVDAYEAPANYVKLLRPIFDTLWNVASFAKCTYFNDDGNWAPPR